MASNERIRKYLDAGNVLGQVSRGRAEEIVRELVNAGDIRRSQAQEWVDNLVDRSRRTSEQVLELVRREVASQLEKIDPKSLESIANQVAEILKKSAEAGRSATKGVTTHAGKRAQGVRTQAGKTATRARVAATKVTPSRRTASPKAASGKKSAAPKNTAKKPHEGRPSDKKAAS
ncbi:MAG: hypothetical protein ACLPYY_11615 [Acidimicrobiales bacterium]